MWWNEIKNVQIEIFGCISKILHIKQLMSYTIYHQKCHIKNFDISTSFSENSVCCSKVF